MNVTTIGIDLAKSVFQIHGIDERGKAVFRKKVSRKKLLPTLANIGPCLVGLEACAGANYWTRKIEALGHTVKVMNPRFVAPYVMNQKNDANDAEGICEAVGRPTMRFVPGKSIEQQDIQALHRSRDLLIKQRTAQGNQVRGLLGEYGIVIPLGRKQLRKEIPLVLEDADNELTFLGREIFAKLYEHLVFIDQLIDDLEDQILIVFKNSPACQAVEKIGGIGVMGATALVSSIGDANTFKNGRQFAAWLGLVPKQHSSGGKTRLKGITKQGDQYLRRLLIHGARAATYWAKRGSTRRSQWITELEGRAGTNRTAVALANKNARIAWAILAKGEAYQLDYQPAT